MKTRQSAQEKAEYQGAWKMRKCKCCKLVYQPKARDRRTAERSIFCSRKCKDRWHKSGGMDLDKLIERVTNAVSRHLLQNDSFLDAIRDKLRVAPEKPNGLTQELHSTAHD